MFKGTRDANSKGRESNFEIDTIETGFTEEMEEIPRESNGKITFLVTIHDERIPNLIMKQSSRTNNPLRLTLQDKMKENLSACKKQNH